MITAPIYMHKRNGKKVLLGMNWYRNANYHESNALKVCFRQMLAPQLQQLQQIAWPVHIEYTIYPARKCDVGNVAAVVSKFFEDALVCHSNLPDDNVECIDGSTWLFGGYDKDAPRCEIEIMGQEK